MSVFFGFSVPMHDVLFTCIHFSFQTYFLFFFPHLEKVYHFWMYFGRRWNPGTCHLSTSEIVRIWTSDLGDRSLRQFFQCDEDCFYLSKRDFFQTMSSQIDQENSRRKKRRVGAKKFAPVIWLCYFLLLLHDYYLTLGCTWYLPVTNCNIAVWIKN